MSSWARWCESVISGVKRLKKVGLELKGSLGYKGRTSLKTKPNQETRNTCKSPGTMTRLASSK